MTRLLLVDDHAMVRAGLRSLLEPGGEFVVAGEAATAAAAVEQARRLVPDVVLMDLRLPDASGVEACREIVSENSAIRVLFLTSYADDLAASAAAMAGAWGFLIKDLAHEALVDALRATAAGRHLPGWQRVEDARTALAATSKTGGPLERLSPGERRVVERVAEGLTNRQIAEVLGLSEKTVKNYLSNAFSKLEIGRRAQAAALFARDAKDRD